VPDEIHTHYSQPPPPTPVAFHKVQPVWDYSSVAPPLELGLWTLFQILLMQVTVSFDTACLFRPLYDEIPLAKERQSKNLSRAKCPQFPSPEFHLSA
jgi:hypothetical protein